MTSPAAHVGAEGLAGSAHEAGLGEGLLGLGGGTR